VHAAVQGSATLSCGLAGVFNVRLYGCASRGVGFEYVVHLSWPGNGLAWPCPAISVRPCGLLDGYDGVSQGPGLHMLGACQCDMCVQDSGMVDSPTFRLVCLVW
jgi:hypothetical protein